MKRRFFAGVMFVALLAQTITVTVMANPNNDNPMALHGFGRAQGRSQPINVNDFHTDVWDRFSFNYQFSSGPDYRTVLGRATQTDIVPRNPAMDNVRRNAGAAFNPPPAGFFSGDFPTERNNIFAIQSHAHYARETTNFADSGTDSWGFGGSSGTFGGGSHMGSGSTAGTSVGGGGSMLPSTSIMESNSPQTNTGGGSSYPTGNVTMPPPSSNTQTNVNVSYVPIPGSNVHTPRTEPRLFEDGSMGRLTIPAIGISNARVFHGSGYDVIDYNIGHFSQTSAWDGNVGLLAHNGGIAGYFERLHTLRIGDEIVFETPFGIRVYEVSFTQTISESDFGLLGWSHENMLTLITCVRNRPSERFALVAVES